MTVERSQRKDVVLAKCGEAEAWFDSAGFYCARAHKDSSVIEVHTKEELADLFAAIGELLADLAEKGERTP